MPKVLISADMEGIAGVVHPVETNPDRYDYERGRVLMTAEVNAVIAGVLDAEPPADVLVADAHGSFRNLLPEDLDQRARLVRGRPRPLGMRGGLDTDVDAVLFVGYHARAGVGPAVLAHTMSDAVLGVRLNGREVGEIGLNAALAGRARRRGADGGVHRWGRCRNLRRGSAPGPTLAGQTELTGWGVGGPKSASSSFRPG